MINVYNSLTYQIARIYKLKTPHLTSKLPELKECLMMQFLEIQVLYPHRKLVIILDSIDQLDPTDYSLSWFIEQFPSNIKIIFSTLPDHGGILNKLRTIESLTQYKNFIEIKSLDKVLSLKILKVYFF